MNKLEKKVMEWIEVNFNIEDIEIEDFPLLPGGKVIKDRDNNKMLVYFHILHNEIRYEVKFGG